MLIGFVPSGDAAKDIISLGFVILSLRDVGLLKHGVQYLELPLAGMVFVVDDGIIRIRGVKEAGNERALREVHFAGVLAEIALGGGFYAVGAVSQIVVIKIGF